MERFQFQQFYKQIEQIYKKPLPKWEFETFPTGWKNIEEMKQIQDSEDMLIYKTLHQIQKNFRSFFKKAEQNKLNNLQEKDKLLMIWTTMRYSQLSKVNSIFDLNKEHLQNISDILNINLDMVYGYITDLFSKSISQIPFAKQDDTKLKEIIQQNQNYGNEIDWNKVKTEFNYYLRNQGYFRTMKQIKHQYYNKLNPNLKQKKAWDLQEDLQLLKYSQIHQKCWSKIYQQMNNQRNQTQIKNRYNSLMHHYCKKNKIDLEKFKNKDIDLIPQLIQHLENKSNEYIDSCSEDLNLLNLNNSSSEQQQQQQQQQKQEYVENQEQINKYNNEKINQSGQVFDQNIYNINNQFIPQNLANINNNPNNFHSNPNNINIISNNNNQNNVIPINQFNVNNNQVSQPSPQQNSTKIEDNNNNFAYYFL